MGLDIFNSRRHRENVESRRRSSRGRLAAGSLTFLFLALLPATALAGDYGSIWGMDSRKVIWFVAQMHLFYGAFVLGVPIFVVIIELVGYQSGDEKFDKLAREFTSLLSVAYATTAAIGGLMTFALFALYPTFMAYLTNAFGSVMWVYALLFFGETFTLYIYYYGWDWLNSTKSFNPLVTRGFFGLGILMILWGVGVFFGQNIGGPLPGAGKIFVAVTIIISGIGFILVKNRKGTHLCLGIFLNVFGTLIMLMANSWASFMMSPSGVDENGVFAGSTIDALINPLWIPLGIHRMLGNVAFGGFVGGAYAAVKFIGAETDEERAHYDWMGYVCNFVGIGGLLPLPFAGYYLGREIYSTSAVMGNNMMGGDFSWTFIIQAMLVGSLFLVSGYYLWAGMGRIPGAERYRGWIKYLLGAVVLSFMIWLTPHNLPLTGEEVGKMGGSQYHPTLKYMGLMPAKNAVVNLIIMATFVTFLLYKRSNMVGLGTPITRQGTKAKAVIGTIGVLVLGLIVGRLGLHYYNFDPASLDLPADRVQYFQTVAYLLFTNCAVGTITVILALMNRGILGQYLYLGFTFFSVTLFLGVYGFVVMEKASPFLRDIAVIQVNQMIACIVLVVTIDNFLWKGAKSMGAIRWGKIHVRSQYALLALCIIITLNMGLMGFIRSGLRTDWHIYGVLQDTSAFASTPSNYTMTQMVGAATLVFMVGIAFMFWLSSMAHSKGHKADQASAEGATAQSHG